MIVTGLSLTNVRAVRTALFRFQPGMNLVIGVNGIGKSTVMDALRFGLSGVLATVPSARMQAATFGAGDIRAGQQQPLYVSIDLEHAGRGVRYEWQKQRNHIVKGTPGEIPSRPDQIPGRLTRRGQLRGKLRELQETRQIPDEPVYQPSEEAVRQALAEGDAPLAVYFSTRRALKATTGGSTRTAPKGIAAAYAHALDEREVHIGEFATWLRAQQTLQAEHEQSRTVLEAFERAVRRFLPEYSELRAEENDDGVQLLVNRNNVPLDVRSLSDGERGLIAMVLDITRRLAQANPQAKNPAAEASAVVLIDEVDLHLHPRWQRAIVHNLTATFPCCQFIATSHSPQVIGEVEHRRVQILMADEVLTPEQTLGLDSSRILEDVMDTTPRAESVQLLIARLSSAIGRDDLIGARPILGELAERLGEEDPDVIRARTFLEMMDAS